MIDKLIQTGEALAAEAQESMAGKFFSSVNFEQWASKSILYLETYWTNSAITEKAKEGYKKLNSNNNYDYYQFLLGSLKALKEFEADEADDFDNF
jgi:hypothetical protein